MKELFKTGKLLRVGPTTTFAEKRAVPVKDQVPKEQAIQILKEIANGDKHN
jgi:hypothetical protein